MSLEITGASLSQTAADARYLQLATGGTIGTGANKRIKLATDASYGYLWFGASGSSFLTTAYSIAGDGVDTFVNAPAGGKVYFSVGDAGVGNIDSAGKLTVGSLAAAGITGVTAATINDFTTNVVIFAAGPKVQGGAGTPEGAVSAPVGSLFLRTDGGAGTSFYVKESGSGTTGWAAK